MKLLITILIISTCVNACSQQTLIGNRRRINASEKQKRIEGMLPQTGELAIDHDSTFYIWGDSANLTSMKLGGWL